MDAAQTVRALAALAHTHRLAIYRLLVEKGPAGLPAGEIAARIGITPSSLTFHVQALQHAGLVGVERAGRQLFYAADFPTMNGLVEYLTKNCCGGAAACVPACKPAATRKSPARTRRTA
ncbi:MAG: helix-turn-helix transcriptional regulator [Proteobacteria bacterium]|nr:helix-turn-helix transcriptional regulator [Pseudomonadota bacterium]